MASISAADFMPSPKLEGNNKYSRRVLHKSGVELAVATDSGNGQIPLRYYRRNGRKHIGMRLNKRRILFALWLALHREGIHLG